MPTIGARLKELREKRGFTQMEIAGLLGMNRANFSHYERNTAMPPADVLGQMADILRVTTDYILGRSNLDVSDNNSRTLLSDIQSLSADDRYLIECMVKIMRERVKIVYLDDTRP